MSLGIIRNYSAIGQYAHLSEEELAIYVDALKLNKVDSLPDAVLRHVSDCTECKSEIVEVSSLIDEEYRRIDTRPYLTRKAKLKVAEFSITYRIAAVLLIGISLSVIFFLFRLMNPDRGGLNVSPGSMQTVRPETGKGPATGKRGMGQQGILADNFSESPNLEDYVNSASRSASSIVLSPNNGAVVHRQIRFEWKPQGVGPVTVKILSNKEKVLKSVKLVGSKFLFTEKLKPGLYYWKLESKDELLYVGKILVK